VQQGFKWIGTRSIRPDGLDKVTGRARFSADLMLPGMLEGAVARSPHPHARILSIDTAAAEAMPGVRAVITGADLPDLRDADVDAGTRDRSLNVIARDCVLYQGHPVAAVAATSRARARAAAAEIDVTYEVLPHVLTVDEAMAVDAPVLHEGYDGGGNVAKTMAMDRGDLEIGFAEADVIVEREFTTKPVHQGYIESHAAVVDASEDGRTHIWVSSQGHFSIRAQVAAVLARDVSEFKVTPAEIGGGFGGKTTIYLEPLAVVLSAKAGRPVRLVMDRGEVFRASGPTSGTKVRVKMGVTKDGRMVACDAWMALEAGAFPGSPLNGAIMTFLASYDIPNFLVNGLDVVCNKPKVHAYRAPGAPMAAFAVESVIDEVALELGMDPIELRLRNAATEGTQAYYGPTFAQIGFVETLEAIRDSDHYKTPLGPNQGRGVASGFWFNAAGSSSVTISVDDAGGVSLLTGSPDIGGSRASNALVTAEELGIELDAIRVAVADTESVGFNDVTGGSRTTHATSVVIALACEELRADLCSRAALTWSCDAEDVEWIDGRATRTDGSVPPVTASKNTGGAGPGFSTQVVDVEVDPETGVVSVVRFTTAQDAGRAIHPSYVEGQMQGGVVQGIGWALNEEYVHNLDGTLENPSFLDYRMPVASDLPMIDTIVVEVPNPKHPYGVRGVGEVGIVPTLAAVASAVSDAVGARFVDLPITPMRVLDAVDAR
ncbi:MAG: xanthine dehydrogenase family protein molybdopterin-binding subunit, partial [Acidimicrobiales bacterium]